MVSFDAAVQRVTDGIASRTVQGEVGAIDGFPTNANVARDMAQQWQLDPNRRHRHLSVDEVAAIRLWTLEFFALLNPAMRACHSSARTEGMVPFAPLLLLLLNGLAKLPPAEGAVFRGENGSVDATFQARWDACDREGCVEMSAFTSSTKSLQGGATHSNTSSLLLSSHRSLSHTI